MKDSDIKSLTHLASIEIAGLQDETQKAAFSSMKYQTGFFNFIEKDEVPLDEIEVRDGARDKDGNLTQLEYFPEEYTLKKLNAFFPGWWTEDMRVEYIPQCRTFLCTGSLCVQYPNPYAPGGFSIAKRFAVGSAIVEYSKNSETPEPSQPDDKAKAARTEWIKLAGKWFGIGLEIYHQKVSPALASQFEDRIADWKEYGKDVIAIANTITKGKAMRDLIKSLPSKEITKEFLKLMEKVPEAHKAAMWSQFVRLRMTGTSKDATGKSVNNLSILNLFINQLKEKVNDTAKQ